MPRPAGDGKAVLSKVGHELRSPLAGIIGLTRILLVKLDAGPVDPGTLTRQLRLIQSSAQQSLAVIEHVVEIAKVDGGETRCAPRPVDVRAAVTDATAPFRASAEAAGVPLRVETPDRDTVVSTDPDLLVRLLRELVGNAVTFADRGEIRVRLTAEPTRPVTIEVADDGPGIPADELERIFAPFVRGALAARRDDGGAGLGLYLARGLADLLGARLEVRSPVGSGATFTVTLPAPPAGGGGQPASARVRPAAGDRVSG